MTTVLIAEDEALLGAELSEELLRAWPQAQVCAVVRDGHAALQAMERFRPEVMFLDVQMPGLNGLELARLSGRQAHIVFITAFEQYAVRAFEEGAVDYLLKPLDPLRLATAVQRLKARLGQTPADLGGLVERLQSSKAEGPLRWITVLHGRELQLITIEAVCYFRADSKYVAVVTADGESLISTPIKDLLPRLDPEVFWQVHRGIVVNINAVRSIDREFGGKLMINLRQRRERLAVGSSYAQRFRQL